VNVNSIDQNNDAINGEVDSCILNKENITGVAVNTNNIINVRVSMYEFDFLKNHFCNGDSFLPSIIIS